MFFAPAFSQNIPVMKYGYARVSLESQSLDLQLDALKKAQCEVIFSEKISGRKKERPELLKLLNKLQKGDSVICYKLDRLGRSLVDLVNLISQFEEKEIRFVSISDGIDTSTTGSKLLLNIMMCIADFEVSLVSERTKAALEAAKKRGVKLGRPKGISKRMQNKRKQVKSLFAEGLRPFEIQKIVGISKPTYYRYLEV